MEGAGTCTMMKYGDSGEYGNKGWRVGMSKVTRQELSLARSSMQLAKQTVGTFASQVLFVRSMEIAGKIGRA